MDSEVAIIGAGLSGLCAARLLTRSGVSVKVLEARDRVGGRTLSGVFGHHRGDLGGQWVGPGQRHIRRIMAEVGIQTAPTWIKGRSVLDVDGKVSTWEGSIPSLPALDLIDLHLAIKKLERLEALVPQARPLDSPLAAELDAMSVEAWKQRHMRSHAARALLDAALRSVFCVEAAELSMLYFLHYARCSGGLMVLMETENGAQQDFVVGGSQHISIKLAAALEDRVTLESPVRSIAQDDKGVTIHMDGRHVRASRVIVAMPPHMTARIDFLPALPARRMQLVQRMPIGASIKFMVTYPDAFWRRDGLSGQAVSNDGPVQLTFDGSAPDGSSAAMVGFIMGDAAREWSEHTPDDRRRAVLADLVRYFGPEAADPTGYWDKDWTADPWSRGCPVGLMGTGVLTSFGDALRPATGRIHWAGTETAQTSIGYMDGAVEAGERAAREVMRQRT